MKARAFGGALHLDEAAGAGHHDVHVGVAGRVLGVVEVEHRRAVDDADRHRGDEVAQRRRARACRCAQQPRDRVVRSATKAPVIAARARAAVGLQHVAVERDRALAERRQVEHRAQRCGRSGAGSPACGPLCLPRAASRSLRVCVARGSMPYSAVTQPSPLPRLRNGGTFSSTLAVHSTRVSPNSISTEPSAWLREAAREAHGAQARGAVERSVIGRLSSDWRALARNLADRFWISAMARSMSSSVTSSTGRAGDSSCCGGVA